MPATSDPESDAIVVDELERGLRLWAMLVPFVVIGLTLFDAIAGAAPEAWAVFIRLLATVPFVVFVLFLRLRPRRAVFEGSALALSLLLALGTNWAIYRTGGAESPYQIVRAAVIVSLAVYVPQRDAFSIPFYVTTFVISICALWFGSAQGVPHGELQRALRFVVMSHVMGGVGMVINVRRIRRLVDAERARREQARRTTLTVERERIARDLHDSVGAQLTGIKLLAERRQTSDPASGWAEVEDLARVGMQELRDTISALGPEALDNAALLAGLRQRIELLASAAGCELAWETTGVASAPAWSPAVSFALLSIVREAVSNALRHGRSKHLRVRLSCDAAALHILVEDDGAGLTGATHEGRGLSNMSRRAERMGGSCRLEARPEGGARVIARLPFEAQIVAASITKR